MDEQMMQQLQQMVMAAMQGDQQAAAQLQTVMQQNPDLKPVIEQIAQQLQGAQSAKNGAKLNYIQRLRGKCPEGYELEYFRAGGKVCSKCMKKAAKACGGKKMENGGSMDPEYITAFKAKCGAKVKKHNDGDKFEQKNKGAYTEQKTTHKDGSARRFRSFNADGPEITRTDSIDSKGKVYPVSKSKNYDKLLTPAQKKKMEEK